MLLSPAFRLARSKAQLWHGKHGSDHLRRPVHAFHQSRLSRPQQRGLIVGIGATIVSLGIPNAIHLESTENKSSKHSEREQRTIGSLLRSYAVFTLCSIPPFVDNAPQILSSFMAVPIVRQITEVAIKYSFFDQVRSNILLE